MQTETATRVSLAEWGYVKATLAMVQRDADSDVAITVTHTAEAANLKNENAVESMDGERAI